MNHTQKARRIDKLIEAWTVHRPKKSFGGMTLPDFNAAIKPSIDVRQQIEETRVQLGALLVKRAEADRAAMPVVNHVVKNVVADPAEGDNGVLYEAIGYVRRSKRATGLHRKKGRSRKK
jgi:hypothetical protein